MRIGSDGYVKINTNAGIKSAHRLVMLTWRPIPNAEDLTVDHLDHNKRNNLVTNLEWVSKSENLRRAEEDLVIVDQPKICFKSCGKSYYFDNVKGAANHLMRSKMWKRDETVVDEKFRTKEYVMRQIEKKVKTGGKYYGTWSMTSK